MAEPRIVRGPDDVLYTVPAEATEAMISAYLKAIPAANAPQAPKAKTWAPVDMSRIPDPDGGLALSQFAEEHPKAAVGGAVAGMLATTAAPAALSGLSTVAGPVLQKVGGALESPATLRQMVGRAISATGRAVDAAQTAAPKIKLDAADIGRIKQLIEAGMAQSEAVRRVWNLKVQNIMSGWKP